MIQSAWCKAGQLCSFRMKKWFEIGDRSLQQSTGRSQNSEKIYDMKILSLLLQTYLWNKISIITLPGHYLDLVNFSNFEHTMTTHDSKTSFFADIALFIFIKVEGGGRRKRGELTKPLRIYDFFQFLVISAIPWVEITETFFTFFFFFFFFF